MTSAVWAGGCVGDTAPLGKSPVASLNAIRNRWLRIIRVKPLLGRFCCSDTEQLLQQLLGCFWFLHYGGLILPGPPGTFPQPDPLTAPRDLLQAIATRRDEAEQPCPSIQLPR